MSRGELFAWIAFIAIVLVASMGCSRSEFLVRSYNRDGLYACEKTSSGFWVPRSVWMSKDLDEVNRKCEEFRGGKP